MFTRGHVIVVNRLNGVGTISHWSDGSLSHAASRLHGGVVGRGEESVVLRVQRGLQLVIGVDLSGGVVVESSPCPAHWEELDLGVLLQPLLHA